MENDTKNLEQRNAVLEETVKYIHDRIVELYKMEDPPEYMDLFSTINDINWVVVYTVFLSEEYGNYR